MSDYNLDRPSDHLDSSDASADFQEVATDTGSELDLQVEEASDRLSDILEIQPENWDKLDETGRLETLQNVEDQMAEIQGRPSLALEPEEMAANVFGGYDGQGIKINSSTIMDGSMPVSEFVDTIIHEGRHGYQDYAIQNPGFDADSDKVAQWADNLKPGNYLLPEEFGQELYMDQPVEADAWDYASRITSALYPKKPKGGG